MSVNIQTGKQMVYNNGESVCKTASGLLKQRKGQSEESYLLEKKSFWFNGPIVQNHTYVTDYAERYITTHANDESSLTDIPKIDREIIIHGLERLYFQRDYRHCLENVQKILNEIHSSNPNLDSELNLKKNKNIKRIVNQLETMSDRCMTKLQDENTQSLQSQTI